MSSNQSLIQALLPCPFCGCAPYYGEAVNGSNRVTCGCSTCGIWFITHKLNTPAKGWHTTDDVKAAWNKRVSPSEIRVNKDDMRETFKKMEAWIERYETWYSQCAQLIDGFKHDAVAEGSWSEWDEGVRNEHTALYRALSELAPYIKMPLLEREIREEDVTDEILCSDISKIQENLRGYSPQTELHVWSRGLVHSLRARGYIIKRAIKDIEDEASNGGV